MRKMYSLAAVEKYLATLEDKDIMEIPGSLLDNYIIYHGYAIEIIEEKYLNAWSSAYVRHIYRKRIPKSYFGWLNWLISESESTEEAEYYTDIMDILTYFNNKEVA